ncbi:hypothetical protein TWF506_010134 [Arthrobotrys conoides]|uniref:C2H2-type domain-containing protein n=1 Tax=Arthrobotrys conoides TaxID=74498 RepID=A0AAN8NLI8_9PEZI
MYQHNGQEISRKHGQPESTDRISDYYYYNNSDCMASWILNSPNRDDNQSVENPWSSQSGHVSNEYNNMNSEIQQYFPTGYQGVPQSHSQSLDTYTYQEVPGQLDFDELELRNPYVILLDGTELKTKQGKIISTPWIYLWKTEAVETDQVTSLAPPKDVKLERARYVKNPEMQAAKAFYNALQIMRRIIQANETELSPHLRTHHERTNCEAEMLESFQEYDLHAEACPSCCSALVNLKHKTSLCELGMGLAEKVFLAIDWYATATFGDYENVTLEVSQRSVRSLLLAFTQSEPTPLFKPETPSVTSLSETAPLQTLAVRSLGIISSVLGVNDKTSINHTRVPKRKRSFEKAPNNYRHVDYHFFSGQSRPTELLAVNTEPAPVSKLDEYLNSPSRRRILRSQIGQEGMRSIRRLYNVSLYGYNTLERAFNGNFTDTYDFSLNFPNHADLLSLGVQTFIELSNEKASYPTALREVYSILHLCDSINQILPRQKYERRRQIEAFFKELEDWRNIIEAAWERSAFELIVKIRWPSRYIASGNLSSSPNPKRVKLSPIRESMAATDNMGLSTSMDAASKSIAYQSPEDRSPMMKALLWMQLIAGIVFTTIAAYFTLNHRIVNALVLYLTGGDQEILDSTRTLDNTTALLPKNAAWISSSSIMFIDKVKRHIIDKLRSSEFNIFGQAVDVAMDSLSCGWISTINSLELLLVRLAKLVECTKSEFQAFVQQVLYLCTVCAANMTGSVSFRLASKKRPASYAGAYRKIRANEEMQSWVADEDEIPTRLPTLTPSPKLQSKYNNSSNGPLSEPFSPAAASLASSRSIRARIQSDFLDESLMSPEERLVSDTASYFPIENSDQDLSGGPVTTYTSIINAPNLDPVLTLENQDNLLALSQSHYGTPVSKAYSQPSHAHYHTSNNFDSFWALNRHGHPLVVSSLPEHAGFYLAPSSGTWNLTEDFLSSANSPSNAYYPPPTSIPTSIPTTYAENLKPTIAASITPTNQGMHRLVNPFLSNLAGSPISPYTNPEETPRFLPTAPTPPPPVPPPKPRKRRRSSPLKEEGNNTSGAAGAPPPKRQKKTMLFKCPICKHDIAAPRMNLTRHIKSVHADSRQRRIECEWPGCATTFQAARKDNYRAHLRKHQEKVGEAAN